MEAPNGSVVPVSVLEFVPDAWPGDSRSQYHDDYARYGAWEAARTAWADANLANGVDDLPTFEGHVPDAPWDPSVI